MSRGPPPHHGGTTTPTSGGAAPSGFRGGSPPVRPGAPRLTPPAPPAVWTPRLSWSPAGPQLRLAVPTPPPNPPGLGPPGRQPAARPRHLAQCGAAAEGAGGTSGRVAKGVGARAALGSRRELAKAGSAGAAHAAPLAVP